MRVFGVVVGVFVGVTTLWVDKAEAIPPFAREYGVPCSTCHITVTRRNEFGDAFRRAGYRWPTVPGTDESGRPEAPVEMRGTSLGDALLPARPPVGLAAYFAGSYSNDEALDRNFTLGTPSFTILFGSNLGKHVAIFGTWGGQGSPNELVAHFSRIAGRPELNLRVGLFEQSTTLFKSNESFFGSYMLGTSNALSGHAVSQSRIGAEANGTVAGRLFWALGTVQNAGPGSPMDGYYHLGYKFGGLSYTGQEPDIDFDNPSFLDDMHLALGHWGYLGKVESLEGTETATVRRLGLDAQLGLPSASIWGGMMLGLDRNLNAPMGPVTDESLTWFGEVSYRITAWLTAVYLYQYQDAASLVEERQQHDIGVLTLLADNVRLRLRFSYTPDEVKNETADLQVLIGF